MTAFSEVKVQARDTGNSQTTILLIINIIHMIYKSLIS